MVNRQKYKNNTLTEDKVVKFEKTFKDWFWDPNEHSWNSYFEALENYYNIFNTLESHQIKV